MRYLLSLSFLALLIGCAAPVKPETVWIGHLTPLSGSRLARGEESLSAIQTILRKAREENVTVAGHPVGVRHVDSAKGDVRAEATRLLTFNRVCGLIAGPELANIDEVVAAAKAHGAAVVTIDERANPESHVIALGIDPVQRGEVLARVVHEKQESKSAVIIVDGTCPICVATADAFARQWRKKGASVRQWDLPSIPDKREEDTVFVAAVSVTKLATDRGRLSAMLREQVVVYAGPGEPGELKVGGPYKPLFWATAWQQQTEEQQLAADAVQLLLDAMVQAKSAEATKVRDALKDLPKFDGTAGKVTWKAGRPLRTLHVLRSPGDLVETVGVEDGDK